MKKQMFDKEGNLLIPPGVYADVKRVQKKKSQKELPQKGSPRNKGGRRVGYSHEYYLKHRERHLANANKYYMENHEAKLEYNRKYYANHKEYWKQRRRDASQHGENSNAY